MLRTSRVLQAAALGAAMLDSRMTRIASDVVAADWADAAAPPPFTVPIFLASTVTGAALPLLHAFLNALRPAAGPPAGLPSPPASPSGSGLPRGVDAAARSDQQSGETDANASPAFALAGQVPPKAEGPGIEPAHFQVSCSCPVAALHVSQHARALRAAPHGTWWSCSQHVKKTYRGLNGSACVDIRHVFFSTTTTWSTSMSMLRSVSGHRRSTRRSKFAASGRWWLAPWSAAPSRSANGCCWAPMPRPASTPSSSPVFSARR